MAEQALSSIKVIDLTWYITGAFSTKLLADYGADVIKVERPDGGDPMRRVGPFFKDDPHPEKSGPFLYLNCNKRGVTLNLKSQKGKEILKELVKDADILVESFRPHVMPGLGLDYDTLAKVNPRLVMTSVSNFGQTGPYREFKSSELITMAMGHGLLFNGIGLEYPPVKYGGSVFLYEAGITAASATLLGLFASRARGEGEHVDTSIQEIHLSSVDKMQNAITTYQYEGVTQIRRNPQAGGVGRGAFPTQDGWIYLAGALTFWPKTCRMIGRPELINHPVYGDYSRHYDPEVVDEFNPILMEWCLQRTKDECLLEAQKPGVELASAPVNSPEDVVNNPHFRDRDIFAKVNHPAMGEVEMPGRIMVMSETPYAIRFPAPLLGQHNEEVYGKLGYSKQDLARLKGLEVI